MAKIKPGNTTTRILDDQTKAFLRAAQRKYEHDFVDMYRSLAGHFRGQKTIIGMLTTSRHKVEQVVEDIDEILTPTGEVAEASVDKLNKSMDEVEKDFEEWLNNAKIDTEFREKMDKVFGKRNISMEKLSSQQKIIHGRMDKLLEKRPLNQRWKESMPRTHAVATGIAGNVMGAALGPIGTLAETAWGIGREFLTQRRDKKTAADRAKITSSLLTAGEETPESFLRMQDYLSAFGMADIKRVIPGGYRTAERAASRSTTSEAPYRHTTLEKYLAKVAPDVGTRARYTSGSSSAKATTAFRSEVSAGMFMFFTGPAFRAKWTKDIYDVLVGKTGVKFGQGAATGGGGTNIFGIPAGVLGKAAAVAGGAALALGGLAMGAWDVYKGIPKAKEEGWLGPKSQELAKGQKVAAGVGSFMAGTGPGVFDKGNIGDKAKNLAWGALKGGLIAGGIALALAPFTGGISMAALPGILGVAGVGSAVGGGLGLIGGKKISQGLQAATRFIMGEDVKTGKPLTDVMGQHGISASVVKTFEEGVDAMKKAVNHMIEHQSKISPQSRVQSGYDAWNQRDPWLAALNGGQLDIA